MFSHLLDQQMIETQHYRKAYRNENKDELPLAESLKDTIARAVPYYEQKPTDEGWC